MSRARRETLILGAAGIAATAAGFLLGPLLLGSRRGMEPSAEAAEALWNAQYPDLSGKARRMSEWRGRVLVCNFWATWCGPCIEEIPMLGSIRERYPRNTFEIVGIAVDNVAKVSEFSAKMNIQYPVLVAGADALNLMRSTGNAPGGLPYTLVADRSGRWVHQKLGALKAPELEGWIEPLIRA